MPYTPTTWTEGVTTLGPTNMNHLETGVSNATTTADGAVPKSTVTTAGDLIYATGNAAVTRLALGAAGTVLKGGSSAPSFATIVNADVDAAAAIDGSKLAAASIEGRKLNFHYGTSLPGSPSDGDIAVLVDSTTLPTYQWMLRYNNGSSNTDKWEFVGGASAMVQVTAAETTSSTTYVALTTAGPSFALPRAGVYIVEIGFRKGGTGGQGNVMSYDIGGTGAVDADMVVVGDPIGGGSSIGGSASRAMPKTGLTALTLTAKYRVMAATTGTFQDRWMRVTPVRVS